jgi:hypothetical protein
MTGLFSETAAQIAATVGAGALGFFARQILRAVRGDKAWERGEVSNMRRALDRLRRRENAYATGFELVLIVIPRVLSPEQRIAVERARQLFATAIVPRDGED